MYQPTSCQHAAVSYKSGCLALESGESKNTYLESTFCKQQVRDFFFFVALLAAFLITYCKTSLLKFFF